MSQFTHPDLDSSIALLVHHLDTLQQAADEKNMDGANRIFRRMESECANGVHITRQLSEHEKQQLFNSQNKDKS